MANTPTEGRNIVHFARKIVAERLIMERRLYENMKDNKTHTDVQALGREMIESYRGLMIGVTTVDLLAIDASTIGIGVINLVDSQVLLIEKLSRYLLLELTGDEFFDLVKQLAEVMIQWSIAKGIDPRGWRDEDEKSEDEDSNGITDEIIDSAIIAMTKVLNLNVGFIVLVLLSDLHHLTYVASADQCLEILLST